MEMDSLYTRHRLHHARSTPCTFLHQTHFAEFTLHQTHFTANTLTPDALYTRHLSRLAHCTPETLHQELFFADRAGRQFFPAKHVGMQHVLSEYDFFLSVP